MNVPINCPICGDPLTNTFNQYNSVIMYKNCRLRADHIFSCMVDLNHPVFKKDILSRVAFTLSMSPLLSVELFLNNKYMSIGKSAPDELAAIVDPQRLPFYFEPDFSDYPKLCNKIKIYLLFS